jgi:hypothetical protein
MGVVLVNGKAKREVADKECDVATGIECTVNGLVS